MKIGLYFGSFNPIHTGHLIIASHVLNETNLQQIWLVVSPQNPFKQEHSLLSEYHRLHLATLAVEDDERLRASDIEFKLPKPSYTIDTMVYLKEKYPQHEFTIIIGSDSFQNIQKWKNASILLAEYSFVIYNRPGFIATIPDGAKAVILDAPMLSISATHIRNSIKERKSIQYLVPEKVREYIEANHYYK